MLTRSHLPVTTRAPGRLAALALATFVGGVTLAACNKPKPSERRYYDEHIQPIFTSFCVSNTSPCHRIDPGTNTVAGNLDLSSFEGVQKRRDVLRNYGAYPQPLLLLKALPEEAVLISYRGKLVPSEIRHAGGKTLAPSSDAFFELKRWMDNGATRDGLPPQPGPKLGISGCARQPLDAPAAGAIDRSTAAYQQFVQTVQPFLVQSCAFGNCHSSPQADFFLTCGDSDEQRDANYLRAGSFVALGDARVEDSELLMRPLSPRGGGLDHTGGSFFANRNEEGWKAIKQWAELYRQTPVAPRPQAAGEQFFGEHVMPVLLKRGCAVETCHSPNGFNDFRLRPGSIGFLSPLALRRNYEGALHEFMSLDTPDPRQSRLVKKNLLPINQGITHRGGTLLEGPGPDASAPCPAPFDPATASAYCTIVEWHRLERQDHAAQVSALAAGSTVPIAFVARPPDGDALVEFDTFRGGADLRLADARLGEGGQVSALENARSALGPCAGLAGRNDLDVRGPEWSPDGRQLVFAARAGEAGGLDLWLLEPGAGAAGGRCQRLTTDDGRRQGAVRVHNFDPVFAPDGSLVFASTRGGTLTLKRHLPGANLYRVGPTLDFAAVEPVTVLTGSELGPAFMQNGQLTFTAEKASPSFYQLSGRRINWDLTDYHPLLGQRAQSDDTFGNARPSVGFQQATEIREALDRNFLLILSDVGALGAGGALAVFNRSVGPFEEGRSEVTFLRALELPDPAVTGRSGTAGVYRSPSSLPDGQILASYAGNVSDPARDTPRYDLVAVDPRARARRPLLAGGALSLVEAAVGFKRSGRLLFRNSPQLVFGGGTQPGDPADQATMHFPDLPMLATLLDANLRRGRNVASFDRARYLAVYDVAAPTAPPEPATLMGSERVFTQRQLLGTAPLESDGSLKVVLPARKPLIFELLDGDRQPIFTMREEHQLGPGEVIAPGVPRALFNGVCAGCHGSVGGGEPDIAVTADALTGATMSLSRDKIPKSLR